MFLPNQKANLQQGLPQESALKEVVRLNRAPPHLSKEEVSLPKNPSWQKWKGWEKNFATHLTLTFLYSRQTHPYAVLSITAFYHYTAKHSKNYCAQIAYFGMDYISNIKYSQSTSALGKLRGMWSKWQGKHKDKYFGPIILYRQFYSMSRISKNMLTRQY